MNLFSGAHIVEMFQAWYYAMHDVMVFQIDQYSFSIFDILKAGAFFAVLAKGIDKLFDITGLFGR